MTYQFTEDWFHWAPELWEQFIPLLPECKRALEIGSYEGRSAVWILENLLDPDGSLVCIDTWLGGEEHSAKDMSAVETRFDHNIARFGDKVAKVKDSSASALRKLDASFRFIYIDGSHLAPDVLTDACLAWQLLEPGGILVFDDYCWGPPRDILHRPKLAIDAFVNIFAEQLHIIHSGYQLAVKRND